jgi:dTDP-4-amino-4,6-dideoxygalactose transaminase
MSTTTEQQLELIEMPGVQTRLNDQEEQTLLKVLREANSLSTAGEGDAFEKEFTAYIGSADAVALSSCSSALEMAAILSGLGSDDEVIIPAHTFVATAVPFARTGATIKWADIDPDKRTICPASIESLVTEKTKVIVAVHLYGLPCDMDEIMAIAAKNNLLVVEDCAQAPGAKYKSKYVGSIGDFGCFSFHTHKNITTLGEGGMLTVRNTEHSNQARRMRWMGNWPFAGEREKDWVPAGNDLVPTLEGKWPVNFCMGEPNCAVGRLLIKRLDQIDQQRREQADRFKDALKDYPELVFQSTPDDREHAFHLMVARYDGQAHGKSRDNLIVLSRNKYKLKLFVQYWPLYHSELFSKFGFGEANVPECDRFFNNMISFPWFSDMPDDLIDEMANRTRNILDELRGG